jgi:cytosine/uracil/thiamine/allantoin permease
MNNPTNQTLPSYITSASPNPAANRAPWYKNTAPTYAGIFLWFVFWQDAVNSGTLGGALARGLWPALVALVVSALICHALFYLIPALLGMKTGLPLYIVGTSTFGAKGGFLMPGFMMGLLQFGWLGVNIYFSALALADVIPLPAEILMVIWGVLAAFMGLKGIQYVAKVATYLPLIPCLILLVLFAAAFAGLKYFTPQNLVDTHRELLPGTAGAYMGAKAMAAFMLTYVVGFFATAGAAGVDFGMNSRDEQDVHRGGMAGIALAIFLTAGLAAAIVAGAHGSVDVKGFAKAEAQTAVEKAQKEGKIKAEVDKAVAKAKEAALTSRQPFTEVEQKQLEANVTKAQETKVARDTYSNIVLKPTGLMGVLLGKDWAKWFMFLLAIAAFPPACFSSFIAANSFKTTLPKVNPFLSVGIGAAVSILLAVTGIAGKVISVFVVIGASFGPICGVMFVDYILSGHKWTGPRSGYNPAGWLSWAFGFMVGILPNMGVSIPAAPVLAFVVGAVCYYIFAKAGLESPVVPLPAAQNQAK